VKNIRHRLSSLNVKRVDSQGDDCPPAETLTVLWQLRRRKTSAERWQRWRRVPRQLGTAAREHTVATVSVAFSIVRRTVRETRVSRIGSPAL